MDYELMLLMKPLTNEDISLRVYPKIEKIVTGLKGTIKMKKDLKDQMGKRLMSYDIGGFREGYYLLCDLSIEPSKLPVLEKELSLMNEVLRFMNVRADSL